MTKFSEGEPIQRHTDVRLLNDEDYVDFISWAEQGYVRARFGGLPVLLTPELATQIRAFQRKQP